MAPPLPAGAGLIGLIAIAVFDRRSITLALIALFVSGALVSVGVSNAVYGAFLGLFLAALTLYAIRQEERVIERVLGLYLGMLVIWASDNSFISNALAQLSYALVYPFFQGVESVIGAIGMFGGALAALFTYSLLAPRLSHMAEEEPLLAMGYVLLGYTILAPIVATVPDYLKLGLALGLLNQFSRALRGNLEALGEVAPVLFILTPIIPAQFLVSIGAVLSIIELAFGVLSRKHLAGAAMWATAIMLV